MRTLKKTLSLVLVVAMVLGLCVVGASATNKVDGYEDAGKIGAAYTEAVGVMTGLGIVDGVTDTELRPENTYQRDQAAKIIAYMLLGKNKADSLSCTVAPFEDVPANHWAAGYIAFCKEQGIIDGVTETTFKPTGTLTGFQWAKMLLCAVGFGVNGEFEGDSWSLNTAKVAHTVDLFAGDLAGADHVALQRQQAMLYAFNALTNVDVVVWSEALGDYIEWYSGFVGGRFTYTGTLGENVWKLDSVTGIIVDNEALNAPATVVNAKAEYNAYAPNTVSVKANTGLDMMYHAARIWYVAGTKANTGVFVYDLAKVETTNCPTTLPAKDVYNIGKEVANSVAYQYDKVDNSAIDAGTANVVLYYKWAKLGARVEVKSTTVIDGVTVANSAIKTDISAINKDDPIIYLKGKSTTTDNAGWHVYAPSATSGTVKSLSDKGVITLADGTTLSPSNIVGAGRAEALARIERILTGVIHDAPTYYFTLDTHGHYITMTEDPYRTVALYTGSWKLTSSHDAWSTSVQYAAQFVDVKTGAVKVVPVRNTWVADNASLQHKGYFDITDELFGDATYAPHAVNESDNYYGGSYAIVDNTISIVGDSSYTFSAADTANRIDVAVPSTFGYSVDGVRFNDETVTFIIVNGTGDTLTVDTYTGVAGLIEGYAKKTGLPITSVTLRNMALVVNDEAAGNKSASVIFAYDAATATGGVVFFPTDVEKWSLVTDSYYQYDFAYLNGEKSVGNIKISRRAALAGTVAGVSVNKALNPDIERGFYFYTVGEDGFCDALTRVPLQSRAVFYSDTANKIAMADGVYWINGVKVASDCKVVDTRSGAGTTVDTIDALAKLVNNNNYTGPVQVFYMRTSDQIDLIYVVDYNLGWIDFGFAEGMTDWTVNSKASDEVYEDTNVVIANDDLKALDDGTTVDIAFSVSPAAAANDATVQATVEDGKVTLPVHSFVKDGTKLADVTITAVTYKVTVTNKQTEFGVCYLNPTSDATNKGTTLDDDHNPIVVNVGDKIRLCVFRDNVPADIEATIYLTGAANQNIKFQGSTATMYGWSAAEGFVPTSNTLVIEKVTAEFTLSLGDPTSSPATNYSFKSGNVDANADKITFPAIPGSTYEFEVYRTAAADTNGEGKLLKLTLSTDEALYSINRYSAEDSDAALNFKFVPAANTITISSVDWTEETQPAT